MKNGIVILLILFSNFLSAQDIDAELKPLLDTAISISKNISYYANNVDWKELEPKIYQAADGAKELEDLAPAFEILLNTLGDHHGGVRRLTDYSFIAHFTDYDNAPNYTPQKSDPETWLIVNNAKARFEYELLKNNVGYLKVVGIGPNVDGQKEAERIRCAINKLHKMEVEKWIVDLRYNGGGNINVMGAGLAPLFDEQAVAGLLDRDSTIFTCAEIKKGDFWYMGVRSFKVKVKPKIENPKIAVLLSSWTASSGELVAVAFKGQKNTRFFGEATGGYTTNNSWDVIDNKIALLLSTGVYCDRNGNAYLKNVPPDEEVTFEITEHKEEDKGIQRAIQWLNKE